MDTTSTNPSRFTILSSLLKADFTVLRRNYRAGLLTVIVPLIFLVSWVPVAKEVGGAFAVASCITFGLVAIGLVGYTNMMGRDRERGVFQRLRVTPATTWDMMISRLAVQLALMLVMCVSLFVAGFFVDKFELTPAQYALALVAALVGGSVYLGFGQALAGLIASAGTLDAVTRIALFGPILGALGELGVLGRAVQVIVKWSPYGTVKAIIYGAMQPSAWSGGTSLALLVTLAYSAVFIAAGIKWFKWTSR